MSPPDGSDGGGVARGRQPIVNRGPDLASLHRRIARSRMAGDEEKHPLACGDRPLQARVDCVPRLVQVEAVKVERPIGLDRPRTEASVPRRIERRTGVSRILSNWLGRQWFRQLAKRTRSLPFAGFQHPFFRGRSCVRRRLGHLPRQRSDCRRNPLPKRLFFSAERAHGRPSPSGRAPAPALSQTCRRPIAGPRRRRPRRCRPGCCP
jgi:hypothetical protein